MLEDNGIADRLLGVTLENASNNSKMLAQVENYYAAKYPNSGFSVVWNQVAHVLNLAAQQILKGFKQAIDSDTYEPSYNPDFFFLFRIFRIEKICGCR